MSNTLADLFHDSRLPEFTLALLLYAPFGLLFFIIRCILLLLLFTLSRLLPKSDSLDAFVHEAFARILTITYSTNKGEIGDQGKQSKAKIIVCNRVSLLESFAVRKYLNRGHRSSACKAVSLSPTPTNIWIDSTLHAFTREALEDSCTVLLKQSDQQLLFFPESEVTNGNGLLQFDPLPFTLARKLQLSILPVCLQASRPFNIASSVLGSNALMEFFWFLFSPWTHFTLQVLSPIVPLTSLKSDEEFREKVRETMAEAMNIEMTQFGSDEVNELKMKPEQIRQRRQQREAEFRQMISLVQQQVPQASLTVIRNDLASTKSVQRTVSNLEAHLMAQTTGQTSKVTPKISSKPSSTTPGSYRTVYERLKHELIERNRQLFIEKYCSTTSST